MAEHMPARNLVQNRAHQVLLEQFAAYLADARLPHVRQDIRSGQQVSSLRECNAVASDGIGDIDINPAHRADDVGYAGEVNH